jgi:hypothetical protein
MTSQAYPKTLEAALGAVLPDTVTIQALNATYVFSTADQHISDIAGGDMVGNPIAMTTIAFTNGILTADNPTITGLSGGDVIAAFVIYNDTGVAATSRLLGFYDTDATGAAISYTSDGTNLPVTFPGVTIFSV